MNELMEVRTPETIGGEIRTLKAQARGMTVYFAVEIGRRLTEAKALVPHGEWLNWLKTETDYSQPTASRLMKIFDKYGEDQIGIFGAVSKYSTLNNLEISKALLLDDIPDEELEEYAAKHDVENMTVKQLEALKKERDEARAALEKTEAELKDARETINELDRAADEAQDTLAARAGVILELKAAIEELENRPVEVAVQEPDPEEIRMRVEAAMLESETKHRAELDKLEKKLEKAQKTAEKAEKEKSAAEERAKNARAEAEKDAAAAADAASKEAGAAKAEAEKLRAEVESLTKQLRMSDEAVTTFKVHFEAWQRAYSAMRDALSRMSDETADKLRGAVTAQMKKWGEE